jgi:redox-sensitive bicupin YhaK (pirin superfamily)
LRPNALSSAVGVVELKTNDNAIILFGYANPVQEPIAARRPFVINIQAELNQAFADFRAGKFNVSAGSPATRSAS